jgi:hypothetical protein
VKFLFSLIYSILFKIDENNFSLVKFSSKINLIEVNGLEKNLIEYKREEEK